MDEMEQSLCLCAHSVTGPQYFIDNFVKTQHPVLGVTSLQLYDYQKKMLSHIHNNKSSAILAPRQMGKTTVSAAYCVHYAIFNPESSVYICSNTMMNARDILSRIRFMIENLPSHLRLNFVVNNKSEIKLENGSVIRCTQMSPCSLRGHSVDFLYIDELAFANQSYATEFFDNLAPLISIGGKVSVTSTANTTSDAFGKIFTSASVGADYRGIGFSHLVINYDEYPYYSEEGANKIRQQIGESAFRREYLNIME